MLILLLALGLLAGCQTEKPEQTEETNIQELNMEPKEEYRFSFVYGGVQSSELLPEWDHTVSKEQTETLTVQTDIWTDPETGLRIIQETKIAHSYGATEWVLRLENTAQENTPLIQNLQIADFLWEMQHDGPLTVAYSKGTDIREDDFLFVEKKLRRYGNLTFSPNGGRSTSGDCMPYFNLITESGGTFFAVGWTGRWKASFERSRLYQIK